MSLPTGAGGLTVLLAAVLGLISLRAANPWLLLIGCALLSPVVVSLLLRPGLRSLSVCFHSPVRVAAGDAVDQVFHVHNRSRRSTPALQLGHRVRGFDVVTLAVPALPPGGVAEVSVSRTAVTRGVSEIHDLQVWTTAPFGMALHRRRLTVGARLVVHPARGPVAVLPDAGDGTGGGRPHRLGEEPHELREWRRGDSLRQVHWRATARHDRLTVVIPETATPSRLALVVHGTQDPDREALLSTAAWTVAAAARSGVTVRLSAAGTTDYVGDDPGAALDWFAALDDVHESEPVLAEAAAWAGESGSLVLATTRPSAVAGLLAGSRTLILAADGRVATS